MVSSTSSSVLFRHGFARGIHRVLRDRSWATTLMLLTALMVLMQFLVVFLVSVYGASSFLISQASLQLAVRPTAPSGQVQELYAALKAEPLVERVEYITSEQAFARAEQQDPDLVAFLEEYNFDNPFPDTFFITLSSLQSYDAFTAFIQRGSWQDVVDPSYLSTATDQEQQARLLLNVTQSVGSFIFVSIAVAFLVLCFVILEWVMRAIGRRESELHLEHMLGGSSTSIVLPYAVEMTAFLIIATVLSGILITAFLFLFPLLFPALSFDQSFISLRAHIVPLMQTWVPISLLIELAAMPFLAFGGALFGVRATLKHPASLF